MTYRFDFETGQGDGYGKRKRPQCRFPRHAELAVSMAGSIASFSLATFEVKR